MNSETIEAIKEKFGRRATTSPLDRELYSRDLAPVPRAVVKPFFKTVPDLIIRPSDSGEVADIVRQAAADGTPITPRAGGSSVFFNAVPVRGGLVLDLGLLNRIHGLNRDTMTVTVGAATTWADLETYLNQVGLACKSMPSSAPSASIGGWLSMMGYGIGSLKYGDLASHVRSVEVVLADGSVVTATAGSDPPLSWFVASEGTLGIITEIELEVRPLTAMKHLLFSIGNPAELAAVIEQLGRTEPTPYTMHFSDAHFIAEISALDGHGPGSPGGCLVSVDYEGSGSELNRVSAIAAEICSGFSSVTLQSKAHADREWQERFRSIRLKRGGPSMLGAEVWLPLTRLFDYLGAIERLSSTYKTTMMSYGHVVSTGHVTAMTMFYSDETRTLRYLLDLSIVKKIQDAGYCCGGSPYGVGLWNTPYLSRIYTKSRLRELRRRKAKLDRRTIMNPGKVYRPPFVLQPLLFGFGMNLAAAIRRIISAR